MTGNAQSSIEVFVPRPPESMLELQVALAQRGFSCGAIDGSWGPQTQSALKAFQESQGQMVTGELDDEIRQRLILSGPAMTVLEVTSRDLSGLRPVPETWLDKSLQPALGHETLLERLAERTHASQEFLRKMNPSADWQNISAGKFLRVPAVGRVVLGAVVERLHLHLADRVLQARDGAGKIVAHFPTTIAREVEKRPSGALHVIVIIPNPDYTFDPAGFPESEEGRQLGRRLILPPGPNNPVGVAWIGLDRPGYGIHGTPRPEQIGRAESHGCFRLANWDVETLVPLLSVGVPVIIEP